MPELTDEQLMAIADSQPQQIQFVGTTGRSRRNNNPFNIVHHPYFAEKYGAQREPEGKFGMYPDMMAGYMAGIDQIMLDANRGHTLASFVNKFAPPHENPTAQLINQYSKALGVSPDTPLAQINPHALAVPMLARESSTRIVGMGQSKPQLPQKEISDQELMAIADAQQPASQEGIQTEMPTEFVSPDTLNLQQTKPTLGPIPTLPGMVAQGLEQNLPLMGMIGGGAAGTALGGPLGQFSGPVGAGLGYAGGQTAQNIIKSVRGEQLPPFGEQIAEVAKGIATGATAEMGGQAVGKIFEVLTGGAMARGVKSALDVERYNMAQDLASKGVFVDPTTIAKPGPFTRGMAWVVNKIEPGKSITQAYRRKALEALTEMRYNFVEQTMGLPAVGSMRAGEAPDRVMKVFAQFRETNPNAQINPTNLNEWLSGLQESEIPKKSLELFNVLKSRTGQPINANEIESLNKLIWEKFRGLTYADKQFRSEILSKLYADLPNDLAEALKFAKATTREIKQAKLIEGLLQRNGATSKDGQIFNPMQFYRNVRAAEDQIMRSLDPQQAKMVFNFAEQMKFAGQTENIMREVGKEESNWLYKWASRAPLIGSLTGAAYNPLLIIPAGAHAQLAWSFIKPNGAVRKLLTSGLPTLPGKAALATKIGITKTIEEKLGLRGD